MFSSTHQLNLLLALLFAFCFVARCAPLGGEDEEDELSRNDLLVQSVKRLNNLSNYRVFRAQRSKGGLPQFFRFGKRSSPDLIPLNGELDEEDVRLYTF
ncbi:hypothetical protein M3Y99_01723000 [Aphelenchoides fujianensis]|nr:hypothetical protein M3Y99_01723000 [Aphelenchoides fujianensis]